MTTCSSQNQSCGSGCSKNCASQTEEEQLDSRLSQIRHKVLVMSGKGGVGKSTVAVNLAISLMKSGKRVGLMDADMHGPSVPKMLGVERADLGSEDGTLHPLDMGGLKVMSVAFLLGNSDEALIWRGPLKMSLIQQFLSNVDWGELDYLVVDLPPGTGDEPLSVCQLIGDSAGAVIVTTPQDVALTAVRKSINFARKLNLPLLGVVENMSGFSCPHCNTVTNVFKSGGGEEMAAEMGVPFLGKIPIDPAIGENSDQGLPFVSALRGTATADAFDKIVRPVLALDDALRGATPEPEKQTDPETTVASESFSDDPLLIAVPVADGKLCMHFGHCEQFAIVTADTSSKKVQSVRMADPPPHEPGALPRWLSEEGANVILAGGMGSRAQELFAERGIKVVTGAAGGTPEELVQAFLNGTLETGDNVCDH